MINNRLNNGFHLVEILIVVAIISILTAFSVPLYSQYMVQQRRYEAESILLKLAVAMEHYQLENNSYRDVTLDKLHFSQLIAKNNYQLIIQIRKSDYLLVAKPLNNQASKDTLCRSLTLNAKGETGITGSGRLEECW